MTDYTKASGQGYLLIRDLGSTIQFYAKPYYSDFWWQNLSFSVTANGTTTSHPTDFDGNALVLVATKTVTTNQTVTFKLNTATNTTSLGGPTTFSVAITRTTKPAPPSQPVLTQLGATSVIASFSDGANGGLAITQRQICFGTSPNIVQHYWASDGSTLVTGLAPGTMYYFWARTYNANGWSDFSSRNNAQTWEAARLNLDGSWRYAVPYQNVGGVWKRMVPYVKQAGVWKRST